MNQIMPTTRWNSARRSAVCVAAALFAFGSAVGSRADVLHKYTFNGNANDTGTLGTANGTLSMGATVTLGGQVALDGVNDFVDLPGATIAINTYTNATFEGWFTLNATPAWQRLFDFGNTNANNQGANYIFYSPSSGGNDSRAALTNSDPGGGQEDQALAGPILTTGAQHHVAVVVDQTNLQMSVYLNGVLATGAANPVGLTRNLAGVATNFAYLGKSTWPDPTLNGYIDEFRIHNTALTAAQVLASFNTGPTPTDTLALTVNTLTGNVRLSNTSTSALSFDYYTITSAGGKLKPTTGWNSLDDQNIGFGPNLGESWDESGGSTANVLAELFLDGSSTLAPGGSYNLGSAFNTALGAGDLKFSFTTTTGELINGAVNYVAGNANFNGDNRIDGADFLIWQRNLKPSGGTLAQGDANGDGAINAADLAIWRTSYGPASVGAAAGVPEPASGALAGMFAVVACVWRRRGH
jgi:hypothetical protein